MECEDYGLLGAQGDVIDKFKKNLGKIEVTPRLKLIQKLALLGTSRTFRKVVDILEN